MNAKDHSYDSGSLICKWAGQQRTRKRFNLVNSVFWGQTTSECVALASFSSSLPKAFKAVSRALSDETQSYFGKSRTDTVLEHLI